MTTKCLSILRKHYGGCGSARVHTKLIFNTYIALLSTRWRITYITPFLFQDITRNYYTLDYVLLCPKFWLVFHVYRGKQSFNKREKYDYRSQFTLFICIFYHREQSDILQLLESLLRNLTITNFDEKIGIHFDLDQYLEYGYSKNCVILVCYTVFQRFSE